MVPLSGASAPDRRLMSVDLPAPFSPRRAWTRPGSRTDRDIAQHGVAEEGLRHAPRGERSVLTSSTEAVGACYFCGEQLIEQRLIVRRVDVAVAGKVVGTGEVVVDVAVVDDRQRHLDEGSDVLALRAPGRRYRRRKRRASWAASSPRTSGPSPSTVRGTGGRSRQ